MANWQIRSVTPDDCNVLTELALRAKGHWGYSAAFVAKCRAELTVKPSELLKENSFYFKILVAETVVGFYAVGPAEQTESEWSVGFELYAMFVEPDHIGKGLGKALFQHCYQECLQRRIDRLLIQSDPFAESFYLKMGAQRVGEKTSLTIADRRLPMMCLEIV